MLRPERFVAVDASSLFGSRIVRSLGEVTPNDASGLAAISPEHHPWRKKQHLRCTGCLHVAAS